MAKNKQEGLIGDGKKWLDSGKKLCILESAFPQTLYSNILNL